ncbi:COG1361 S-layer family protein [Methanoregula sp.]|uniref:COG1361 S-layer family protein n=1 Tax=Methanoregula sp. TaxID=2052170 RepID=UPI003BAFE2A9
MASIQAQATILIIIAAFFVAPALAGTKYLDGTPNLNAYIAGINEYSAGGDIQIPVVIENDGMSTNVQVAPDIIDRADLPTTAKFVTVAMSAGDAPIVIKSDPQMIGDLASQTRDTVTFDAKVNADAPAGTYSVPLNISYTQFSYVDQFGVDTFRYYYVQDNVTVTIPLVIKPEVIPEIVSATSDQLIAGADGYVNLTIKNIGSLDGAKATVKILQDDDSPVTPVDSSVFIGAFPAGGVVSCQYKVNVAKDAENKTYPVDVIVIYQNDEGDFVTSQTETVGVDVGNKVDFTILSPPAEMSPGSKQTILVEYQNTGNSTIESAEARISIVDPFTSTSDVAYLGDLKPGQSAVASFQLSVASDATLKEYGLDSEIRYRDALDDTYISDPMKVSIDVKNLTGFAGIVSNPLYISVLVAVLIGLIYAVYHLRRKK